MAESVEEAVKKEKKIPVHEVFLDDDWSKAIKEKPPDNMGKIGF